MGIAGKYQLIKNEKFYEYIIALGTPEDKAKAALDEKPIIEIKIDGKALTISTQGTAFNYSTTLTIDQEVEEKSPIGTFKSTTKVTDDSLIITSVAADGKKGTRSYKLSGNELVLTLSAEDGKIPTAKRFYKKI